MAPRISPSFWVFILVLVVLHLVLHVAGGLGVSAPDLITVALLLGSRRLSGSVSAALGLVLGLLLDAMSITSFGALALVYAIVGFLGARSRDLFEGDSLLFVGLYVFIGKWLCDALFLVITRSAHGDWGVLLTNAPIAAVYTAVSAMVALTLYRSATGER